jgi:ABC-2 type transport system permease protein/lipopolysaccharide transport system permease protein
MNRFRRDIAEMFQEQLVYRELLFRMTTRDLMVRYKQSVMGFGWAIFTPLVNTALFSVIFTRVARVDTAAPYPIYAFTGLLFWNFFASSLRMSVSSLAGNVTMVSKVYFPREIFPFSAIMVCFLDMAVASSILAILMFYYRLMPAPTLVFVPVLLLIQTCFTAGVALLLSMGNLYFRDVKYLFEPVLLMWMFATSVVYPLDLVGGPLGAFFWLNPMTALIDAYRDTILLGTVPEPGPVLMAAALALVTLLVGWLVFHRLEYQFAEVA